MQSYEDEELPPFLRRKSKPEEGPHLEDQLDEALEELEGTEQPIESKGPIARARLAAKEAQESKPRPTPKMRRGRANTGPKGVIADYNDAKLVMRARRLREKISRERMIQATGIGTDIFSNAQSITTTSSSASAPSSASAASDLSEEDLDLDEDDLKILQEYESHRLEQIQAAIPHYGKVRELQVGNFIETVDSVPACTWCVVHLYQPYIEACLRMNFSLDALAPLFSYVLFTKIVATDALPNFSDVGCPCLILFKGGKQLHSFVRVTRELGMEFSDRRLANFLASYGVLNNPEQTMIAKLHQEEKKQLAGTALNKKEKVNKEEERAEREEEERRKRAPQIHPVVDSDDEEN